MTAVTKIHTSTHRKLQRTAAHNRSVTAWHLDGAVHCFWTLLFTLFVKMGGGRKRKGSRPKPSDNGQMKRTDTDTPSSGRQGESVNDRNSTGGKAATLKLASAAPPMFFNETNNRIIPHQPSPTVQVTPTVSEGNKENASQKWIAACQRSGRMGSSEMLSKDLTQYVRYELFAKLKFIMSNKQMNYSKTEGSFCFMICSAMGLVGNDDIAVSWWEEYKDTILVILNNKRADVTAAIKRAFLSKFYCNWRISADASV
jgi:hypothetical protein